ncbi:hypothetical protein K438DRAFT_1139914 [Mycena galopus ATCC 62051]|nr:hypothetical protein K438DRAFT_1139914 [Mycena galopus ATCC 62051]
MPTSPESGFSRRSTMTTSLCRLTSRFLLSRTANLVQAGLMKNVLRRSCSCHFPPYRPGRPSSSLFSSPPPSSLPPMSSPVSCRSTTASTVSIWLMLPCLPHAVEQGPPFRRLARENSRRSHGLASRTLHLLPPPARTPRTRIPILARFPPFTPKSPHPRPSCDPAVQRFMSSSLIFRTHPFFSHPLSSLFHILLFEKATFARGGVLKYVLSLRSRRLYPYIPFRPFFRCRMSSILSPSFFYISYIRHARQACKTAKVPAVQSIWREI